MAATVSVWLLLFCSQTASSGAADHHRELQPAKRPVRDTAPEGRAARGRSGRGRRRTVWRRRYRGHCSPVQVSLTRQRREDLAARRRSRPRFPGRAATDPGAPSQAQPAVSRSEVDTVSGPPTPTRGYMQSLRARSARRVPSDRMDEDVARHVQREHVMEPSSPSRIPRGVAPAGNRPGCRPLAGPW